MKTIQSDTIKKEKVYCDNCKHFIIQDVKRNKFMQCRFKRNKVRGMFDIFAWNCKDKELK